MELEKIGFYTLCNHRAENISPHSPMWRCELLVTDRCNFKCPYCMPLREDCRGDISWEGAQLVINTWADDGLKNIRFSGGEPTLHPHLIDMVTLARQRGIERIAVSTNGSHNRSYYDALLEAGVNDVSISLDACCSSKGDMMSGVGGIWSKVVDNIARMSAQTYVTVGVVLTYDNISELSETIEFAHSLGVADIRIISAAQENLDLLKYLSVPKDTLDAHPILKYRVTHFNEGRNVRGLTPEDAHKCYLLQDDSVVAGGHHYPCIIYLRQYGKPIGKVYAKMREDRVKFFHTFNPQNDPICKRNCLDVCVDFNNTCRQFERQRDWKYIEEHPIGLRPCW